MSVEAMLGRGERQVVAGRRYVLGERQAALQCSEEGGQEACRALTASSCNISDLLALMPVQRSDERSHIHRFAEAQAPRIAQASLIKKSCSAACKVY